jgi:signal peptidase I
MFNSPSDAMLPTLQVGDVFHCMKLTKPTQQIRPGDVVVAEHLGVNYVKRIVATEGQSIRMLNGRLELDGRLTGQQILEDYVHLDVHGRVRRIRQIEEILPNGVRYTVLDLMPNPLNDHTEILPVPPGHVALLGDNRDISTDSRFLKGSGGLGMIEVKAVRWHDCKYVWSKAGKAYWQPVK